MITTKQHKRIFTRHYARKYAKLFQDVYNTLDTYILYCAKQDVPKWKKRLIEEKYFNTKLNPGYKNLGFVFEFDEDLQALKVSMTPRSRKV